jgi:cysteinyl-tRNA synthetase
MALPSPTRLEQSQVSFRLALCDSFDTPKALQVLLDLVSTANIYLARGRSNVNIATVVAVAEWVTRMLRMFGLGEGAATDSMGERVIGWGQAVVEGQEGAADVSFVSCCSWLLADLT